ncbi:hypothetical protein VMCG_05448 [Cytospora schulzeri]|uniref:Uncharacterized protein n=1 Tax=Cytospora schulzeri TaxID=448051 RepID=A0A423WKD6_9PEZI|nr:hypothetical protein VMCG_05448 [Valsa malicola]
MGLAASGLITSDSSLKGSRHKPPLACPGALVDHAEGNALLAACFALTFQSLFLQDVVAEYMAFVRGIFIVAVQMAAAGVDSVFSNLLSQDQEAILRPHVEKVVFPGPMAMERWGQCCSGGLETLCAGDALKVRFLELTLDMTREFALHSVTGFASSDGS